LGVDVFLISTGALTYKAKLYNCDLLSTYDAYNQFAATSDFEFWNCNFVCDATGFGSNKTRCLSISSTVVSATLKAYGCLLKTLNCGTENNPVFSAGANGRIELHNCVIDSDESGSGDVHDVRQFGSGVLLLNGVVRNDGLSLTLAGVPTYMDVPLVNLKPTATTRIYGNTGMVVPSRLAIPNGVSVIVEDTGVLMIL